MLETERIAAPHEIVHQHSPNNVRTDKGKGKDIAARDKRRGNALVSSASAAIAGNLRNFERCQLRLGVLARVTHQLVCNLPGSGNPRVGKDAAPERAWKIDAQNAGRKISAIPVEQVEAGAIR